jgi:4-diphosphocytidyl-2-C-methyl-D-erythritol kinase
MSCSIVEIAPAKVNLFLEITAKRADGFHELDSLFVFASTHDEIAATPADHWELSVSGPFSCNLASEAPDNNLALKAAKKLAQHLGLDQAFTIQLTKNLPVAAGLGGGSADAAAALRAICRLAKTEIPDQDLEKLALELGADVPSCLSSSAQIVRGIGELRSKLPYFPTVHAVLVNPLVPLSTAQVFKSWAPKFTKNQVCPTTGDINSWIDFVQNRTNCLQSTAIQLCPAIAEVLEQLAQNADCFLARMSGSGPSCFGLYPTAEAADAAATHLSEARPGWWAQAVELG